MTCTKTSRRVLLCCLGSLEYAEHVLSLGVYGLMQCRSVLDVCVHSCVSSTPCTLTCNYIPSRALQVQTAPAAPYFLSTDTKWKGSVWKTNTASYQLVMCLARYNQPTTASTADVLDSYSASVSSNKHVPRPRPVYQEALGIKPPASSTAPGAVDFQLLRLGAGDLPGINANKGLAELLRPAGVHLACCATLRVSICSHQHCVLL